MLLFLDEMDEPMELRALPHWKAHMLTGNRKGTWSLSVTANRRLTFRLDSTKREILEPGRLSLNSKEARNADKKSTASRRFYSH
jgi:plasmid maintenance system killer protein